MNVLFLGLSKIESFSQEGIYSDFLRGLINKGVTVYSVTSVERRYKRKTFLKEEKNGKLLVVKTFNIQKTNVIEKGIGTLFISHQYTRAIKKYFKGIVFDVIVYPTPPISFYNTIRHFKRKNKSKTYLMLKDIFPQNAIDIGILKKTGIKGIIYHYFRKQEKKMYQISDMIGCMSNANVEYILEHNKFIKKDKIEVFPNCVEIKDLSMSHHEKALARIKYNLPVDKKVLVYGGNLGKPQGIDFLIDCLKAEASNNDVFFLIVGDGTEYDKIDYFVAHEKPLNTRLIKRLPKNDFDNLIACCDVGLIFLDYRFTIPNFPSRLLSYMQAKLPILACTDKSTDIGRTIVDGKFGWWCFSKSVSSFSKILREEIIPSTSFETMKRNEFFYLKNYYDSSLNVDLFLSFCNYYND